MNKDSWSITRLAHNALGLFASTTIQGAVCLSVGGALTCIAILAGCSAITVPFLFFAGMAVPLWPLRLYYSPERVLKRKFAQWDRLVKTKHITPKKCKQLKEGLVWWYSTQQPSSATAKNLPQLTHQFDPSEPKD